MADLDRTIRILFEGEDHLSSVTGGIRGELTGLVSAAQAIAEPLAEAGRNVLKLDAALAALAAAGLTYAFQKSKDFESAYVDLDKVLGDNENIEVAKERAKQLADVYGESVNTMLSSMATFRQAGFKLDDAMGLTKASLDLMIAGDISLGMATEDLTAILKGFKAEASDAGRIVDILNEVSNNYAASTKELAKGMAGISPIAKTMGFSFEETAGLLTPVIEVFRSGDEAAIALKTGLLSLQEPSKSTETALKALGVAQKDSNGNMRDGKTLFYEVAGAFGGLTDAQKTYVAQLLFGKEQAARMMEVFNGLPTVLKVTNTAMESTGSAAKEVGKRLETAQIAVNQFKSAFEQLGIEIGNNFRGSAVQVIKGATEIEQALRAAVVNGSFKVIFDALNDFDLRFSAFLKGVAKALPEALSGADFQASLNKMTDALKKLTGDIGGIFAGLDLTNPKDLEKALAAIVDTTTSVIQVTDGMVNTFKNDVWPIIKDGIDEFNALSVAEKESIGGILQNAILLTDKLGILVLAISGVSESGKMMHGVLETVFGAVQIAWNTMSATIGAAALGLVTSIQTLVLALKEGLNAIGRNDLDTLYGSLERASKSLVTSISKDLDGMASGASKASEGFGKIGDAAAAAANEVKKIPGDVSVKVEADAEKAREEMGKFVADQQDYLKQLEDNPYEIQVETSGAEQTISDLTDSAVDKLSKGFLLTPEVDTALAEQSIEQFAEKTKKSAGEVDLVFRNTNSTLKDTKKKIDELPAEKKLKLELENKIETEKIKQQASIIEKMLDFRAKIEIADMEAQTERIKALAASISEVFKSAGDVIGSLFGDLKGFKDLSEFDKQGIFQIAGKQMEMQREAQKLQRELTEAQIRYLDKKTELFGKEVPIKIETAGVEPEIESFMWKILTKIRIRAAADEAEFLLGLQGAK